MPIIMPYSVFFHIPKTGGTCVTRFLIEIGGEADLPDFKHEDGLDRQHTTLGHFLKNTDLKSKKTFCFVSNPLTNEKYQIDDFILLFFLPLIRKLTNYRIHPGAVLGLLSLMGKMLQKKYFNRFRNLITYQFVYKAICRSRGR